MAIIKKYRSEVVSVVNYIDGIYTVQFRSLEKQYKYNPGQFLHIAIDEYNPSMQWPDSRCFSMQSNPDDELLKITFSVKGDFTKRMSHLLTPGREVYLKLPYGDLFLKDYRDKNCVFIAGGTGITPFLSLFTHTSFSEFSNPRLYFGVRDVSHNLYQKDFARAVQINTNFSVTIIDEKKYGKLDVQKIFSENKPSFMYFISGPPVMIKNFRIFLLNQGVVGQNIVTDDWE